MLLDRSDCGVMTLFAISQADRSRNLVAGQVLEGFEVFFSVLRFSRSLHGAGESKLSGGVKRIDGERLLEHGNGLVVVLKFGVADASEVVRIGIVRIELDGLLKAF